MKKLIAIVLLLSMLPCLTGCGSMFEKEYVHISEYSIPEQNTGLEGGKKGIRSMNSLKQAILDIVYSENGYGSISFDPSYDGDVVSDMANACWQIRTQDAMCAYCVDNIAYEISKIVSYYEAEIYVSYSKARKEAGGVYHMPYATGIDAVITNSLALGKKKIAVLVGRSSYSAETMAGMVEKLYRLNPNLSPNIPKIEVNVYSGDSLQKLYEINLDYGLSDNDLRIRRSAVNAVKPFKNKVTSNLSQLEKALLACDYLVDNCLYDRVNGGNSVYSALVTKKANSEGLSYAFVELCRQLGLNCRMINGQSNWQDHWWNIVEIEGDFYHVDVSQCMDGEFGDGFLLSDKEIWESHRWDVSSYPICDGELVYEG